LNTKYTTHILKTARLLFLACCGIVYQVIFGNAGHLNKWMPRHLTVKKINKTVITFNAEHPFRA